MMTTKEAKNLVMHVFDEIKKSKTIKDFEAIAERLNIPSKNLIDVSNYPKIEFSIKRQEINNLIKRGILTKEYALSDKITNSSDTLTKLLYSLVWKNGELKKLRHIIQGIIDGDKINDTKENALVFYNFGRYLTKKKGLPIIDQHVIRAFAVYKENEQKEIKSLLELQTINREHKNIIDQYRIWLDSTELKKELKSNIDYSYYLDKLLFAIGKTIKHKKVKRK
jgi:hypothetical protein